LLVHTHMPSGFLPTRAAFLFVRDISCPFRAVNIPILICKKRRLPRAAF
jgi:hypothetical protein